MACEPVVSAELTYLPGIKRLRAAWVDGVAMRAGYLAVLYVLNTALYPGWEPVKSVSVPAGRWDCEFTPSGAILAGKCYVEVIAICTDCSRSEGVNSPEIGPFLP